MYLLAIAVVGLNDVALRMVCDWGCDDESLCAHRLRNLCPLRKGAGLVVVGPHYEIGWLFELLILLGGIAKA
jgi:hypothetical protein